MPTTHREPLCLSDGVTIVQDHLTDGLSRSYPTFIAHTGSCARPKSSCQLRLPYFDSSLSRHGVTASPAGRWPFPIPPWRDDLCIGAWVRTPPRLDGALVRFFPSSIGLPLGSRGSAPWNNPTTQLSVGNIFGAATIRLSSGSHTCLAHRLL